MFTVNISHAIAHLIFVFASNELNCLITFITMYLEFLWITCNFSNMFAPRLFYPKWMKNSRLEWTEKLMFLAKKKQSNTMKKSSKWITKWERYGKRNRTVFAINESQRIKSQKYVGGHWEWARFNQNYRQPKLNLRALNWEDFTKFSVGVSSVGKSTMKLWFTPISKHPFQMLSRSANSNELKLCENSISKNLRSKLIYRFN